MQLFEDQDAKPVYQGKATARGIKCDVWRQARVNWPGEYKSRMIWRWYFTQSPQQPVRSRLHVRQSFIRFRFHVHQSSPDSNLGHASRMFRAEKFNKHARVLAALQESKFDKLAGILSTV